MSETAKETAWDVVFVLALAAIALSVFAAGYGVGVERGRAEARQAVKSLVMALGGWKADGGKGIGL